MAFGTFKDPGLARRQNLVYLDAICRWAEALVDFRTAEVYGDLDHESLLELRSRCNAILEEVSRIAREAEKEGYIVPFEAICRRFSLSPDEIAVLRLALVPVLDSTFRKRIARYKDNVLLDYVDVDFLLSVLYDDRISRLMARDLFSPEGTLVKERLITMTLPRDAPSDTFLAHEVRIPDGLVQLILGYDYLDKRISSLCTLTRPNVEASEVVLDEAILREVRDLLKAASERFDGVASWPPDQAKLSKERARNGIDLPLSKRPKGLILGLFGPPGTGKSLFASYAASMLGRPLLTVDSARLATDDQSFTDTLDALFSDAKMRGAILAFDHCEALFSQRNPRIPSVYERFEGYPGIVLLLSNDPKQLDHSLERYIAYQIDFEMPDIPKRERLWRIHVAQVRSLAQEDLDLAGLAMNFEFTGGQIRNAVQVAKELAFARGDGRLTQADLTQGAWAQVRADMEEYSKKRHVGLTLDDLILPEEEKRLVAEVIDAAKHRTFIMTQWGFGKRLTTGRGLCCLFVGEPGTGKTLAAEILAAALGQGLYQISIPRVMSKYIGETEKNIERIFATARANNSILLFDEADALFTTRVKVETSVDRFSNMEINLLLQEIERFDGVVILTTNLEKNIDKAFERRIQFKIRFPFPDAKHRAMIWKTLIPRECPIDPDIDWDLVGRSFELSGGHIKNAILRAAYKAARDQSPITLKHIVEAAEAECKAAGRLFRGLKREED